ncbi:hypothetical protein PDUR_04670 [Paenibacillus durus]|uniref:Uncharacterized protein n=1 Tax=Paenibacillus durus TaxID=44251 RepID=A0A089HLV2_PAEDU|nr:hypothetical protein PDUR_04670 [Paenibacillus durus]
MIEGFANPNSKTMLTKDLIIFHLKLELNKEGPGTIPYVATVITRLDLGMFPHMLTWFTKLRIYFIQEKGFYPFIIHSEFFRFVSLNK